MNPITILDVAKARGVQADEDGAIPMSEFGRVGLSMMGGCLRCHASIAAYNAHPSRLGYWLCGDCVGDDGFETVASFEAFVGPAPDAHLEAEYESRTCMED